MLLDDDHCYRAIQSRDARFDGWFVTAVRTTHIYCRPSCPAITPKRQNVEFFRAAATAQAHGYRACKRCRPDASPGSPEWNSRADVVGRAMRLIADGLVDREGVGGLANRLGYSERQVNRLLVAEVGSGPLALARAQRAQTARILIETTTLPITEVAFAAGFQSVRQFNDTVREVYAASPSDMRAARSPSPAAGPLTVRLACREPFDGDALLGFLALRAVPGVESVDGTTYRRSLRLARGLGVVSVTLSAATVSCALTLDDVADAQAAVQRTRRLLDLDCDPASIRDHLAVDPLLAPLIEKRPGLRAPGHPDSTELLVRAVLGQQVSVAGARTLASRLVAAHGEPLTEPVGGVTHAFPSAATIAGLSPEDFAMPRARGAALIDACAQVADGSLVLDAGSDRAGAVVALQALQGIGPWTAGYVAMRALGDPDVFLPTDLGVRHALAALGADSSPRGAAALAEAWRPWRSYALHHLWASL
ncbi:MAG: DNA-3-methyladenine glycosylase 2 family protein [Ilumatobacteraceae bacterium]|nr:DNA-3-methyladenine glycosylase 2 family protein [Acidimicrobiaceae bacterium]MBP6487033.1 DNA-3-methyladenine glycosylase 2 family protein [Ilumatobacteraceae bacterium]MBP7890829.1 DNA-3-methyladenine glycosylase 2 family protein [Ilumatobacteraceae bacterium]MBP8211424.1 DNA-3-methyladenine glycosylase 2 family protein [Ilumatobacteraceae bacterium]MBP9053394.1 DNA-3-methyladenine glycosylase 2 family protein [Ilumatobacteraceae bacterium]